jgi:xeroderma pigmentosum group C-complementing protein
LHKTELLSWIGHGNFVNARLNDVDLMKSALKLLPKNKGQCYPKDKTDIDYFKQITAYYKQEMKLRNTEMYCYRLKNRPPLMMSLALQMHFKSAICRRDYVLIFATLLRSIGIQCRIVQNLRVDPKICPKSELLSLSKKTETEAKKSDKSKTLKRKKSSKKMKISQLDGGNDEIPKRKTRSAKNDAKKAISTPAQIFSPKVKVQVDSPNRTAKEKAPKKQEKSGEKIGSAKTNRALEITKKVATLNVFSPRKTRSMSRDQSPKPSTSSQQPTRSTKSTAAEEKKDVTKPNLQKLATKRKAEENSNGSSAPKVSKIAEKSSNKTTRKREQNQSVEVHEKKKPRMTKFSESSDDGSLKYFKMNKSKSARASTSNIDRRVLSSDGSETSKPSGSPKKSKGVDVWIEAYSEKEEKWITIDVHRGKVDCVGDIKKTATQPLVYVFAWNNDNSIKDVSARYCKDFNTRIRKMRVDSEYLNSVLHLFASDRTSRDFKEDDELNKLQLQEGMPKSIAE